MPRYVEINAERLAHLHEGLELLEQVDREGIRTLDLHLYGISNNPQIVDAAKEAIADSEELAEQDVQLSEVAVAIPLSSDTVYYLDGSGLILRKEDFAYMGSGGEGVRTQSFAFSHYHPRVTLSYFTKIALASSVGWLDDFLRKEGSGQAAQVTQNVRRTEEATQPGAPAPTPAAPATPQAPQAQQMPKQTSLRTLASLLDEFLD
jgi:hypothetical protein